MPTGIKYLKVAKIDADGIDRSDHLRTMSTLRLDFTDLGLVGFQVTDVIEKTNHFVFTVNPTKALPGGAITSSDNIIYNYTSSIPSQNLSDARLSGSLTQAKEITDLALSGGYSNFEPDSLFNFTENNHSTMYGWMNAVNYGYYNESTKTPTTDWDSVYPYNNSTADKDVGLTTSTFLMDRLQSAGEFINMTASIALPPQLQLITASGYDYGTEIRVNRTPNTTVPITFTVGWCNADTGSGDTGQLWKTNDWISPSFPSYVSIVSESIAGGGPVGNSYYVWMPGKVMLGCYKNGVLQDYTSEYIYEYDPSHVHSANDFDKTAVLKYSSSLNDLGVVKDDILSFKIFGYSNYMVYYHASTGWARGETERFLMVGKLSGSTLTTPSSFLIGPPSISESFRNATQDPIEVFSGPPSSIVSTPLLSQEEFDYSGADILMNNVDSYPPNPYLNDLDYETSQTIPVNFQAILNNTATKGNVPESNYTQLSSINSRYLGTKNQTEKINQWVPKKYLKTAFNKPFNIGTWGKTSPVESLSTILYEFDWGGGTTPEILGWTSFNMGKIFQINTTESATTILSTDNLESQVLPKPWVTPYISSWSDTYWGGHTHYSQSINNYYYVTQQDVRVNDDLSFFKYNNSSAGSSVTPKGKALAIGGTVPPESSFAIFSKRMIGSPILPMIGLIETGSFLPSGSEAGLGKMYLTCDSNYDHKYITPIYSGYQTGSSQNGFYILSSSIMDDLDTGDHRWFMTFYNNMEYPIDNSQLEPMDAGYSASLNDADVNYQLASKGVYEICAISESLQPDTFSPPDTFQYLEIFTTLPFYKNVNGNYGALTLPMIYWQNTATGDPGIGILFWRMKNSHKPQHLIIQNEMDANTPGCFINRYSPEYISQNIEKISKTLGSNTF